MVARHLQLTVSRCNAQSNDQMNLKKENEAYDPSCIIQDRLQSFSQGPGTYMFLHWLAGILCAFYFASFVLLLREVLRPGVLWFLRNLNDPDFNPVQEVGSLVNLNFALFIFHYLFRAHQMIHLPILRHLRQFAASLVIFGTIVFLMLWVPIRILQVALPNFLPYYIVNST
jgi:E3 ubiquitin-protein ligase MARCH6